ncbi:MAG: class I SAM-dependent methyltransferase [Selenomonadaceae bacterium]|nr:class I SAM-dependent methyltransferase [Selenomonadaceae bacterium]
MRYQDYVIKDGKFIGEFEKMYQKFDDPWLQTKEAGISYSRANTVCSIRRFGAKNILEVGCGLGYFTAYLNEQCPSSRIIGMDISETAIEKARKKFPKVEFICGDLAKLDNSALEQYDCIIFSEIMWYILDNIDDILLKIKKISPGGV